MLWEFHSKYRALICIFNAIIVIVICDGGSYLGWTSLGDKGSFRVERGGRGEGSGSQAFVFFWIFFWLTRLNVLSFKISMRWMFQNILCNSSISEIFIESYNPFFTIVSFEDCRYDQGRFSCSAEYLIRNCLLGKWRSLVRLLLSTNIFNFYVPFCVYIF